MPTPDAVAAALARLVTRSHIPDRTTWPQSAEAPTAPERVVAEAETALDRLPTAAAFVADGGEQRLRRVVEALPGDDRLAKRGRRVLKELQRLRTAVEASALEPGSETRPASGDHFHRGRTTLLKGDGVATDR